MKGSAQVHTSGERRDYRDASLVSIPERHHRHPVYPEFTVQILLEQCYSIYSRGAHFCPSPALTHHFPPFLSTPNTNTHTTIYRHTQTMTTSSLSRPACSHPHP
ncbi:hypothetical protein J4Q44_G00099790 [Coregonus suidteri]|uniref:Uncharacterized protein n=1 Tax=Coregonus suidteri TaxID=861788 RepID=A0AAN8R131_9TELE